MRGARSRCRAGTAAALRVPDLFADVVGGHQRYRSVGGAQAVDDGAEDVGECPADQEKSIGVGLGRGELQQRHDVGGGREPVLGHAVMPQFQELFVADAGQAEDLERGEEPKRLLFFIGQVPSPLAGHPFSPGEVACGLGGDASAQRSFGAGITARGWCSSPLGDLVLCGVRYTSVRAPIARWSTSTPGRTPYVRPRCALCPQRSCAGDRVAIEQVCGCGPLSRRRQSEVPHSDTVDVKWITLPVLWVRLARS